MLIYSILAEQDPDDVIVVAGSPAITCAAGGSSTLRRTLAGLLLDTERYQTRRTDRVVILRRRSA